MYLLSKLKMVILLTLTLNTSNAQNNSSFIVGNIAPNAKYLEADFVYPFNNGSAIIKKGQATALINSKGDIIIPFNKYLFDCCILNRKTGFADEGLFKAVGQGIINSKGEAVNNKIVPELRDATMQLENEGLVPFTKNLPGGGTKSGYKDLKGKIVIQAIYDGCFSFSDGLALVVKQNEFNELKYGFIDNTGKVVIDFSFTVKPSAFYNGLAIVYPKGYEDYYCAFINKKGEIIRKYTRKEFNSYGNFDENNKFVKCVNGVRFNERNNIVLNESGAVLDGETYLAGLGIKKGAEWNLALVGPMQNGIVCYKREFDARKFPNKKNIIGILNLDTHKAIEGPFYYSNELYNGAIFFDNTSKLAYAEVELGKDASNKRIVRRGYINEEGLFVLLLKETSSF